MQTLANRKIDQGLISFSKYAFAPNYLRYCGPNKNEDIAEALEGEYQQNHLFNVLSQFEAAVPYLNLIARANNISNPFDPRVVEAYWIGNELLYNINLSRVYNHFNDTVRKRAGKNWSAIINQIKLGAKPHHSFHVLDVYRYAGKTLDGSKIVPVIDMINKCRIGYGRAITTNNSKLITNNCGKTIGIKGKKIILSENKLQMVDDVQEAEDLFGITKVGDLVSVHWGFVCDKITLAQAKNLDFWTKYHLNITNLNL